ncbi:MAG: hypothetical protein JWO94_2146, partial [Verrucomicrobiaceae bacterium]|nr:hypothetical protein [Verrucomicrobiaceae bacterium]
MGKQEPKNKKSSKFRRAASFYQQRETGQNTNFGAMRRLGISYWLLR